MKPPIVLKAERALSLLTKGDMGRFTDDQLLRLEDLATHLLCLTPEMDASIQAVWDIELENRKREHG